MPDSRDLALAAKAWPFEEARKLLERFKSGPPAKGHVLFETGYGPSGLPHIGTFGEVARTSWVRQAFHQMSDVPTRLVAFSDDMDGLRKVPDNVPNQAMLREHLGKPLTSIPDPFGTHSSFGAHNNARLKAFLDRFRRTCLHEKGKAGIEGKAAVGICVAGGGGGGAPACALSLEKVLGTCGFDLVDLVPVRRQNLEAKLHVLRLTGDALAGRMK